MLQRIKNFMLMTLLLIIVISIVFSIAYGFTETEVFGKIKPITILQYSTFLFFALLIEKYIDVLKRAKKELLMVCFLLLMAVGFELLWSFFFWFAQYNFNGISSNLDALRFIPSDENKGVVYFISSYFDQPINLNVSSKIYFLLFFLMLYLIFMLVYEKQKLSNKYI